MWIGHKWPLSINDLFFSFGTFCFIHFIIYTRLAKKGGPAASLTALKLVSPTAPHTCNRTTFRASSSMYNNPAKFTTQPQTATRGMTHVKDSTTLAAWLCYNTAAAPRNKRVFQVPQICITTTQIQRFIHSDSQFLLKLGWWWCCCQCSPMYIM